MSSCGQVQESLGLRLVALTSAYASIRLLLISRD